MTFLTCGDFGESTRAAIVKKLFDRYDILYGEWLTGQSDSDLGQVIYNDAWVNRTWYEAECLSRVYCKELLFTWFDTITVHRWLWTRHGMTELPKRKTIYHYTTSGLRLQRSRPRDLEVDSECSDSDSEFSFDDMPVLEPQNQAFVNNILGAHPVEHEPRRSTRAKKQTEFYYGF